MPSPTAGVAPGLLRFVRFAQAGGRKQARVRTSLRLLVPLLVLALAGSAGTYTVRRGETLGGIAVRLGVSLGGLVTANNLRDPDIVREGQVLTVPGPAAATPVAPPPPSAAVHRVASGESLGLIARKYGTTIEALAAANGIRDVNRVREGTVLRVASAGPSWVCPVQGWVRFVSGWGDPRGSGRAHQGVDIAAPKGTPVVANVSGVVTHRPNPLGGNAYYLKGDDGDTYYGAHLDSFVGPPRRVQLGEAIGRVGQTGNALGGIDHLHFERLARGGSAVNPGSLLVRACWTR